MPKHLSQEFVDSDDDRSSSPRGDKRKGKVRRLTSPAGLWVARTAGCWLGD